jgi:hypothetical protein
MYGSSGKDGGLRIAKGTWTGEHIRLEVAEQGADVEFDCAHGHIDGPLLLDQNGKFDRSGSYTPEHGGPVRAGEMPPTEEAHYVGVQEGAAIKLKIMLTRAGEVVGSFVVSRNGIGRLMKCK